MRSDKWPVKFAWFTLSGLPGPYLMNSSYCLIIIFVVPAPASKWRRVCLWKLHTIAWCSWVCWRFFHIRTWQVYQIIPHHCPVNYCAKPSRVHVCCILLMLLNIYLICSKWFQVEKAWRETVWRQSLTIFTRGTGVHLLIANLQEVRSQYFLLYSYVMRELILEL